MDCNLTATQSFTLVLLFLGKKWKGGRKMQVDLVVKSTSVQSLLLLIINNFYLHKE